MSECWSLEMNEWQGGDGAENCWEQTNAEIEFEWSWQWKIHVMWGLSSQCVPGGIVSGLCQDARKQKMTWDSDIQLHSCQGQMANCHCRSQVPRAVDLQTWTVFQVSFCSIGYFCTVLRSTRICLRDAYRLEFAPNTQHHSCPLRTLGGFSECNWPALVFWSVLSVEEPGPLCAWLLFWRLHTYENLSQGMCWHCWLSSPFLGVKL